MSIENKAEKLNKEQWILANNIERIIYDGLRAYGIEPDKISEFTSQIRDVVRNLLQFPQRNIATDHKFQGVISQLWDKAAMRNPDKEGDIKRAEIWQFINQQVPLVMPQSEQEILRNLVFEILEDEDLKRKKRKDYEDEIKKNRRFI
jgi:hypothetical protein